MDTVYFINKMAMFLLFMRILISHFEVKSVSVLPLYKLIHLMNSFCNHLTFKI